MEKIDVNRFLPFGASLRDILLHPSLTGTDLKYILRQRGIFVESIEDDVTFPLLSSMILSPLEFEAIKDRLKTKEDKEKIITRNLDWDSKDTLITAVPSDMKVKELISAVYPRYKITHETNFAPINGNPDKVKMEFKCETHNYNSSWYRTKSEFKGQVILEKVEKAGKVYLQMIYTSPETQQVSDKIIKTVERHFKSKAHVKKEQESERILYKNFTNADRVKFLLSLTEGDDVFEFVRVTSLEIGPDPTEDLPVEFKKFMSGKVNDLSINGETLHESFLLSEVDNYKYVELAELEVEYNFQYHAAEGNCRVRFGFEGYLKKRMSNIEFRANIAGINLKSEYSGTSKSAVYMHLLQEFEKLKIEKYNWAKYQSLASEFTPS